MNRRLNTFDQILQRDLPEEKMIDNQLLIRIRHLPVDPLKLKEAYFEIERRTKNIISTVFEEFEINGPKEKYVKISNTQLD